MTRYTRWLSAIFSFALCASFSTASAAEEEDIEEVVVTGSYIKGTPEDAPLPVTTLRRDDLALEGAPTAIDLIKSLSFSQGADGETDQFQAGAGADRATVNIRGLGPSRSLVLINGRRTTWSPHAIGAQAQLLVDVNIMPSMAIERIELLRDGAAATYGSDAIAGVMNFITRGDFEGFEISASHKEIQDSDGDQEFGAIWGRSFMNGRAHFMTSASYIERSELDIPARDWALRTYSDSPLGGWSSVGRPAVFVPLDRWNSPTGQFVRASSGGFAGLLATGIVDPNCEDLGGAITSPGVAGNTRGGFCRFQYTAFDNLIEDAQRWQWYSEASFEIDDSTNLSLEFLATDSEVPNWGTSPSYPPNRLVDEQRTVRANNPGLIDMAGKYPEIYGPYASCSQAYCTYAGDEWDEVAWFYGRYYGQDGPPRGHPRENKTYRFAGALDGRWRELGWQVAMTYSSSERSFGAGDTMVYRDERGREGLGGFECERQVPNEYNAQGQLEFSLATLQANAGQGPCSYWIPFSNAMPGSHELVLNGEANNPDFNSALSNQPLRDYMVTADNSIKGDTSLLTLEGIVTGSWDALNLGAGPVDYAVGIQYRNETYQSGPDDDSPYNGVTFPCAAGPEVKNCTTGRTGLFNFLPPGFDIDENRNVWALFAELNVPLLEQLEGQFSIRHEDYGSATGSTTDPKIAFKWQIMDSIGLRASFGSTFRGPTLNQIVPDNSSNSLQFVGVTGAFKRIDTKGNPGLKPEQANTINVGLLVDHDGLVMASDNLFVTLDYWSYDFTDPLVTEPFNDVLALACSLPGGGCDPNGPYFGRLTFGSSNPIATDVEIININIVNGPDIETDGVDFTLRYGMAAASGYLSFDLTGTKITSYDIGAWEFGDTYDALGRLNYRTSLARTLAEWKGRFTTNYNWQDLNVRWVVNAVDEYEYGGVAADPDGVVNSHVTHDVHVNYDFMGGQLRVIGSILNMEDEDPPDMLREMNYDAFTHNPFGRMFKIGATYSLGQN